MLRFVLHIILFFIFNLQNPVALAINDFNEWVIVEEDNDINNWVESFILAPECGRYPLGAKEGLKTDLTNSLRVGVSGLLTHRPNDYYALRTLILGPKTPKIFCAFSDENLVEHYIMPSDALGLALPVNSLDFPAIAINLTAAHSSFEVQRTIFHELMHLLDYRHYKESDIAYLAENCFFSKDELVKSRAAKLLKEEHSWLTKEYQIEFFRIMEQENLEIALRTALVASQQLDASQKIELWDSLVNETNLANDYPFLSQALPGTNRELFSKADGTQKPSLIKKAGEIATFFMNKNYDLVKKNIASYFLLKNCVFKVLTRSEQFQLGLLQNFISFNTRSEDLSEADLQKWRARSNDSSFIYKEKTLPNCFLSPPRLDSETRVLEDISAVIQTFEIALQGGSDGMKKKARESLEEKSLRFSEKYLLLLLSQYLLHTGKTQGPYMLDFFIYLLSDESLIMQKVAARALRYVEGVGKDEVFSIALKSNSKEVVTIAQESLNYRQRRS